MKTYSGTGPVRVTTHNGRTMIECWSEKKTDDPTEPIGYFRVGGLDEDAKGDWRNTQTSLFARAEWKCWDLDDGQVQFDLKHLPTPSKYIITDPATTVPDNQRFAVALPSKEF